MQFRLHYSIVHSIAAFFIAIIFFAGMTRAQFTEVYSGTLPGVWSGSVAWGDYDNDGRLDFILAGNGVAKIYHNTGSGFAEAFAGTLTSVQSAAAAWGDYDNDGKVDILLTGRTGSGAISKIYHNTGSGFSEVYSGQLTGIDAGSVAWGDYDCDGKLDILIVGRMGIGGANIAKLYRNTGAGFTEVYAGMLPAMTQCSVAWGDYDNDGRPDILLAGFNGSSQISKVYRNTGSGFADAYTLQATYNSSVAWGDYDNDGRLDILLVGGGISKIYHNTGSGFSEAYAGSLQGMNNAAAAWGDYDNDGKLDILITGDYVNPSYQTVAGSKIYHNTGSGFSEAFSGSLMNVSYSAVSWADYDNDGKLDILLCGDNSAGNLTGVVTKMYKNSTPTANTAPTVPSGLAATSANGTATLHWNRATDAETPQNGLSYNLRLGTSAGDISMLSPMANTANGFRRVVRFGNGNEDTAVTLTNLAAGTYYWSVQSVDNGFSGSSFASEGSFTVSPFVVNPSTLSFGSVNPGSSKQDSITIRNTGASPLTVTSISSSQAEYAVSPTSGVIPPGGSLKVYVTFAPTSGGTKDGTITIVHSAFDSPVVIAFTGSAPQFTEANVGTLLPVMNSSVAFGDYDNDGRLDIAMSGWNNGTYYSKIYHNNGGTFTEAYAGNIVNAQSGSVAWGDYDNDGKLDLLVTGYGSSYYAKIYRNTGSGFTEVYPNTLTGVYLSSAIWGDYNNDGKLDILLTGYNGGYIAKLYRNTGSGFVMADSTSLPGVYQSATAWGDYDNDGKLDILLTGYSASGPVTKLFHNTGSGFSEVFPGTLTPVSGGSVAWGDYDNDGYQDILLSGGSGSNYYAKIYHNDAGAGFTEAFPGALTGVTNSSVAWGDYDNDGKLDILLTGFYYTNNSYNVSKVYRNTGTGFTEISPGLLTGVKNGASAWGDFDNDGKLDILLTGNTSTGSTPITKMFHNTNGIANTAPVAPSGLSISASAGTTLFHWNRATDAETPQQGLSYNLRIGATPGGGTVLAPMADSTTGLRRIPSTGNMNEDTSFSLNSLPNGTYYWGVQAVDHGYAGSPFAGGGRFVVGPGFSASPVSINFGIGNIGSSKVDSVTVTNSGADALSITSVTSALPEVTVTPANATVPSGTSMKFYITFIPASPGAKSGNITFIHNAPGSPSTIAVTATVQPFSEVYAGTLPTVYSSNGAWGDYDNDGKLDLVLTGTTGSAMIAKIFHNDGNGFTEAYPGTLPGVQGSSPAWCDYDNDGKLDLLLTGQSASGYIAKIYHNTGIGFSEVYPGSLTGVNVSAAAWGDYDNDGRPDILLTGWDYNGNYISKIYHNTGNGFTEVFPGTLTGIRSGAVAWGDYDNDGKPDIFLSGQTPSGYAGRIYHNTGSGFTLIDSTTLPGIRNGAIALGDYNSDGRLDILLTGATASTYVTKIFQNTGSGFTEVYNGSVAGAAYSSAAWGDYDNDGKPDILLLGNDQSYTLIAKIYRNTGSGFSEVLAGSLTPMYQGFAAWGDYDNDGRLDIALTGRDGSGNSYAKIYHNNTATANTSPIAPIGLAAMPAGTTATLTWSRATDAQTPQQGLSYNIRLGTSSGDISKLSPMSDQTTGLRRIAAPGNSYEDTAWTIGNLTNGTYYWSVQAVDPAYAGSAFANEGSFTISVPIFTANAASLSLGSVNTGTSKMDSITVTNTGTAPLTVTGVTNSTTQFSVTPSAATIAPSGSQKFYVTFSPTTLGAKTDTLSFTDDASGSPHKVSLSGSGVQPVFYVNNRTKDFGSVGVGSNKTDSLTVYNTGSGPMSIASVGSTSDEFTINPTNAAIPGGGNAKFYITFTPATIGVKTGSIIFTHNGGTAPDTISVTGTVPAIITAASVDSGIVSPSGTISVAPGASQAFTMTPKAHYHIDSVVVDGVNEGVSTGRTFTNVMENHTLTAYFSIDLEQIVATSGPNGTIDPSGNIMLPYGGSRRFTFTPATGYHVDTVLVDGARIDSIDGYTFTNIVVNHTIVVSFAINRYTIDAAAGSNGQIFPSGAVSVNYGETRRFLFTPSTGYHTDSVMVDGIKIDSTEGYTFRSIGISHTIRVTYAINMYNLIASAVGNGSISPSGELSVSYGSSRRFTFTPATGWHIDSVVVDRANVDSTDGYTFGSVTAHHAIIVYYSINRYPVVASAGANGNISLAGTTLVRHDSSLAFIITPATGYHIDSLFIDGVAQPAAATYSFEHVTSSHSIHAAFAIDTFIISATAGPNGSITPSGTLTFDYGMEAVFTFQPERGYEVDSVVVDGVNRTGSGPGGLSYTFSGIAAGHTIGVSFKMQTGFDQQYRSFTYDSLIVAKALKKSPVTEYWEFKIKNAADTAVNQINITFLNDASTILECGSLTATGLKKGWKLTGTLAPGDSIIVKGRSPKAKPQVIAKLWLGPVTKTPAALKVAALKNIAQLPMPNAANLRDELYKNLLQGQGGLTVGIVKSDSNKFYGWVRMKKSGDMFKSLFDKVQHSLVGNGFVLLNGKPFVKEQTSLSAQKHNDRTFADLLALKVNIAMSRLGMTPRGFGELRYTEEGNPFAGMLVRDIATLGDSMMTLAKWPKFALQSELYGNLDAALMHINAAFSDKFDTLTWSDSLRLTSTRRVIDVDILAPSGVAPATVAPLAAQKGDDGSLPQRTTLYQNYPNPFNPTTTISFDLREQALVTIKVYNLLGQEVATLLDGALTSGGASEVAFDANRLASGVYFYRLVAEPVADEDGTVSGQRFTSVKKMLLVR